LMANPTSSTFRYTPNLTSPMPSNTSHHHLLHRSLQYSLLHGLLVLPLPPYNLVPTQQPMKSSLKLSQIMSVFCWNTSYNFPSLSKHQNSYIANYNWAAMMILIFHLVFSPAHFAPAILFP
jgi:hypothetical protein